MKSAKANSPPGPKTPKILLTGDVQNGRYRVAIGGKPVWLTNVLFTALCNFVRAQIADDGHSAVDPTVIFRLRRAIDSAGRGHGMALIVSSFKGKYHITTPLAEIAIAPSFVALPVPEALSADLKAVIVGYFSRQ